MKITNEKIKEVYDLLNTEKVYPDEIYTDSDLPDCILCIDISWGDWKHDHLWARDLMSYLGYVEIGSKVTEEDGSDAYSAEHYFMATV